MLKRSDIENSVAVTDDLMTSPSNIDIRSLGMGVSGSSGSFLDRRFRVCWGTV